MSSELQWHVNNDNISSPNRPHASAFSKPASRIINEMKTKLQSQEREISELKEHVAQLENHLEGTQSALNRAVKKYTATVLINESPDESNSICILTFAGILMVGAYLIPWFI